MHKTPQVIEIFDRRIVRRNRNRAYKNFEDHSFLFEWTIRNLADRLQDIKRDFPLTLHLGARGSETSLKLLQDGGKTGSVVLCDISENFLRLSPSHPATATPTEALPPAGEGLGGGAIFPVLAEEEFLPFADNSFDLVFSPLALHTVNDLPGALIQINRVLKPDGLFLGAMFGGETLYELRKVMMQAEIALKGGTGPHIAPFADKQQTGALLQRAGFALPVVDSEVVTVTYEHAFKLMRDLRGMGEGNSLKDRGKTPPGKALFMETARMYQQNFTEPGGRLPASFEIIFMVGWAPHVSQQKPLRPGSAKNRLADALSAEEIKTGIKPE